MIKYKRTIQVEAYRLSKENIDEMMAWTKWKLKIGSNVNDLYLQNGEKIAMIGDWIVKDEYTNKVDFYTMDNYDFINKHTQL